MANFTWANNKSTTGGWGCCSFNPTADFMIAGEFIGRVYISTDYGSNWTETQPKGAANGYWQCSAVSEDGQYIIIGEYGGRLYVSSDSGSNWIEVQPDGNADRGWGAACCNSDGTVMAVSEIDHSGKVWISTDYGSNWTGVQPSTVWGAYWGLDCDYDGSVIICADYTASFVDPNRGRIWISTDSGSNWTESRPAGDTNITWTDVACDYDGTTFIACASNRSGDANGARAYYSTDSGSNWTEAQPAGNNSKRWCTCAVNAGGTVMYLAIGGPPAAPSYTGRMYSSIDTGANWSEEQPAGAVNKSWLGVGFAADVDRGFAFNGTMTDPLYFSERVVTNDFMMSLLGMI